VFSGVSYFRKSGISLRAFIVSHKTQQIFAFSLLHSTPTILKVHILINTAKGKARLVDWLDWIGQFDLVGCMIDESYFAEGSD